MAAPEVVAPEVTATEVAPKPPMKSFIPMGCSIIDDFKVEKASSKQDRGSSKTTELRPLEGEEDVPLYIDPSVKGQPGAASAEKKKRKRKSLSSPGTEVKPKERTTSRARKPKKSTNSRVPDSDSLCRLRDESEEDDIFVAHESTIAREQAAAEGESGEVDLPPTQEAETETRAETSREAASALKEVTDVIDIMETPSYTESMLEEAQAGKEKSSEGVHGPDDPLHSFFDGVDMSILEDFSGRGDVEIPKKDVPLETGRPSSSPKFVKQFLLRV
ncbi:protein gar2-like [Nicotiana tomentosiformis]|uniref:protein gar2-like n=1 Tax=Nicotiana tomentosiformis TaxID=4098 RepID=UPI00388C64E5